MVNLQAAFNICENMLRKINFKELVAIRLHALQNDKGEIRLRLAAVYTLFVMLWQLW